MQFQNVVSATNRHQKIKNRAVEAKRYHQENCAEPDLNKKFVYLAPSFCQAIQGQRDNVLSSAQEGLSALQTNYA